MIADQHVARDLKIRLQRRRILQCVGVAMLACGCLAVVGALVEDRWSSSAHSVLGLEYNCSATYNYADRHQASFRQCQAIRPEFRRAVQEVRRCLGFAAFCAVMAVCSLPPYLSPQPSSFATLATHLLVASTGVRTLAAAHTFQTGVAGQELAISFSYAVLGGLLSLVALFCLVLRSLDRVPELCERVLNLQEAPETAAIVPRAAARRDVEAETSS